MLAGEAAPNSPPAALEALAITVRTYALANRGRHHADGFDLCDQTHCQVMRAATVATERAAAATAGQVLLYQGVPASVYYTASCGGRTEIPSAVWPGAPDPPFLPSRADDACAGAPAWTAELSEPDLVRALRAAGFRGDGLRNVRILAHDVSGRVARLRLEGLQPDEVSGQDLRVAIGRTLGWQYLKSTAFDLQRIHNGYSFTGRGSGHGVGLCVIGSVRLAAGGRSAAQILGRYFPGLEIGSAKEPLAGPRAVSPVMPAESFRLEVIVSVPDGDEGERARIADLAGRAGEALARELAVRAPARVTLRIHDTIGSYEQATGRSWFTSGAVVAGEVHLVPLTVLREQGVLERTIRHELVHVLADPLLANRRMWVREGAAIYFAGERPIPGERARPTLVPEPRASCPEDAELERPISVGTLASAYARARACFARQIAAGRKWTEVH